MDSLVTLPFHADVEHRGDMRMVERRRGPRLLFEARQTLGIARVLLRQHLHRYLAPQPRVLRQPHLAHATRAELLENLVRP